MSSRQTYQLLAMSYYVNPFLKGMYFEPIYHYWAVLILQCLPSQLQTLGTVGSASDPGFCLNTQYLQVNAMPSWGLGV